MKVVRKRNCPQCGAVNHGIQTSCLMCSADLDTPKPKQQARRPQQQKRRTQQRFCNNCGTKLALDLKFCTECGTKVGG